MKPDYLMKRFNDCGGYVLVISLIMLIVLGFMGAVVMNLSGVDLKTSAYEKMSNRAFFSAESGITQARNDMQVFLANNINQGQWPAADCTVVNGVKNVSDTTANCTNAALLNTYSILVNNTPINYSYSIVDFGVGADNTVLVTSTGTFPGQNISHQIEAVIRYEPPDLVGSQECYTAKCSGVDQSSGKQVVAQDANNDGNVDGPNSTVSLTGS